MMRQEQTERDDSFVPTKLSTIRQVIISAFTKWKLRVRSSLGAFIDTDPKSLVLTKYGVHLMNSDHEGIPYQPFHILVSNF